MKKRMSLPSLLALCALLSFVVVGVACSDKSASPDEAGGSAHAAADVVPGSHEDWCGEHAVPESQCTQCHEELIAAFKATGDWCDEHGLPESHCRKCNPDLVIERPAKGS